MNRCYNFDYKTLKEKATTSNSLSSEVIEKFHILTHI